MSFRHPFPGPDNLFYSHYKNNNQANEICTIDDLPSVSIFRNNNPQLKKETDFVKSNNFIAHNSSHSGNTGSARNANISVNLHNEASSNVYSGNKSSNQQLFLSPQNYNGGYANNPQSTNELHLSKFSAVLRYPQSFSCTSPMSVIQSGRFAHPPVQHPSQTSVTNTYIQNYTPNNTSVTSHTIQNNTSVTSHNIQNNTSLSLNCSSNYGNINYNDQQKHESNFYSHGQNARFQTHVPETLNNQNFLNNPYQTQNSTNIVPTVSQSVVPLSASTNNLLNITNTNNVMTFVEKPNYSIPLPNNNFLPAYPVLPVSIHMPPPMVSNVVPTTSSVINSVISVSFSQNMQCSVVNQKELKLSDFLKKFLIKKAENFHLTIPDFRSALKTSFLISKELLQRKHKLSSLLESDEDTWNSEMKQITELQEQLSEICNIVSSPSNLNFVLKKLKSIKKKREQKRKTKLNALTAKMEAERKRKELNQEIDKWLDGIKEKNLKLKREAEMKKDADYILLEVRRKIHEAKRTIEKIKVFEKLRNARQANAIKKGLHMLPEHNENFERKVCILKHIMSKQLSDYEAEEKALKVMLETEQEGQLEEEAQWKLKKVKMLQQKRQKHIYECLFGCTDDPLPSDPLYLFHKYHASANNSIENLVQIRHHWDVYLESDGENIPQQWIVPVSECDASWKQWLSTS